MAVFWAEYCSCFPSVWLESTRRRHVLRDVDPEEWPRFCDNWDVVPVDLEETDLELKIPCFQELRPDAAHFRLHLTGHQVHRGVGCPVKIPANVEIELIEAVFQFDEGYFQVFSGDSCRNVTVASSKFYERKLARVGTFEGPHNVLLFKPTHQDDHLTFAFRMD